MTSIFEAGEYFFTFMSILTFGVGISTFIVSNYVWKPTVEEDEEDEEDDEDEEDYEEKYREEYDLCEERGLTIDELNKLNNIYISEKTPNGLVKMCWNNEKESFVYYTNNSNIPYKDLEVVSRIYVVDNDCKKFHVDFNEEIKLAKEKMLEETDKQEKQEEMRNKVFAKFKMKVKKSNNKKFILRENSNRYSYGGTVPMLERFLEKEKEENEVKPMHVISYAEWKAMKQYSTGSTKPVNIEHFGVLDRELPEDVDEQMKNLNDFDKKNKTGYFTVNNRLFKSCEDACGEFKKVHKNNLNSKFKEDLNTIINKKLETINNTDSETLNETVPMQRHRSLSIDSQDSEGVIVTTRKDNWGLW